MSPVPRHALTRPARTRRGRTRPRSAVPAIVAEGFASRLGLGIVSLALPLYALHLGMSVPAVGLLVSSNVLVQLVAKPVLGGLVDRFGLRRSLLVAIAVRSAVPLLLVVAQAPWQLFAIRGLYGLGQALRDPALNAVIAEVGGKNRVASTFAWYHTAKNVAASVGRAVAGGLLALTGSDYPLVFAVAAGVSVLPLVTVALAVRPGPVPPGAATERGRIALRQIAPFTGLAFLFGTTAGMMNLFPVIASRYLGLGPAQIGGIMLATTVVVILGGPLAGWLADTVSRRLVLAVRAAANAVSSVLYLVLPGLIGMGLIGVGLAKSVDDFGKAAFRPAWGSMMAEVAARDPARRARTMALIELGEDGGDALGPLLAGMLLGIGGLPLMLGTRVVLAVVTELACQITERGLRPDAQPQPLRSQLVPGSGPEQKMQPIGSR
jgi:MFS family permease